MTLWNKKRFALGGYSFGADIVPFLATRFSGELQAKLKGVYLISPSEKADFEIHISDMLSLVNKKETYDVVAETKKLDHLKVHCLFGDDEEPVLKIRFSQTNAHVTILPGSHHFNNDFVKLAEPIWKGCSGIK
jgi:type IV secretory pathway VirJ component